MRTSLVCLLLLVAVVCAAPKAKQTRKARLLQEGEKARLLEAGEMQNKKRAEVDVDAVDADVEEIEAAFSRCPSGPCIGDGGQDGFIFEFCQSPEIQVGYIRYNRCYCCCDPRFAANFCRPMWWGDRHD